MKKKYIIIQIITIIGILSIVSLFKILSYRLEIRKNERILLNYFNLESTYGMIENSVSEIEICKNNSPQEYNVTKLVDYYLEQLKSANDNKEIELIKESFYVNDNYYRQYGKNFTKYISDYKVDIDLLVEELKTILFYKDDNWFIPINASDRIELPYGYYLEYSVKGMFEKLNKVKRIQNVHLIDMFILSNKSENSKSKTYNISIDYIDNNDTKQNVISMATYNYDNKLWNTSLYNLYYKLKKAEIRLCHHAYDKEREEEEQRIDEEMAQIKSEEIVAEEKSLEKQTGCHIEYKHIFDNLSSIKLIYYISEDRYEYKCIAHVMKKDGDLKEFMRTLRGELSFVLPYKEKMTIDEVTEKFLKDREQVKKALALWDIDLDMINEKDIIKVIKEKIFI